METSEVSTHLYRVYRFVRESDRWVTSREIAEAASVAPRTARAHVLRLVREGLVDQAELFPGHRYHFSPTAEKRNRGFVQRLEQAGSIFSEAD